MRKTHFNFTLAVIIFMSALSSVFAQNAYQTKATGKDFRDLSNWDPVAPNATAIQASDFTDGSKKFIIKSGHAITHQGTSIGTNVSEIEIEGTGVLELGNNNGNSSLTIGTSLVVKSGGTFRVRNNDSGTHTLNMNGSLINAGSVIMVNGTGKINTTIANSSVETFSGNTITFNDLTINGGNKVIFTAQSIVNGTTVIDGAGTEFSSTTDHQYKGSFTVSNNAIYKPTINYTYFNGVAQTIDISGSTNVLFNNVRIQNGAKTINGDLISSATTHIYSTAKIISSNRNHSFRYLQVDSPTALELTGGSVTFTGSGRIRYGDETTDETITIGVDNTSNVKVIMDGYTWFERGDIIRITGDLEIKENRYLVIDGYAAANTATEKDSELQVFSTTDRTLTMKSNCSLYIRGKDNFPTGFKTYTFDPLSYVRYDLDYNQTIRGTNSAGNLISYSYVFIGQAQASVRRTKKLNAGENFTLRGNLQCSNGASFESVHAATIKIGGSITTNAGDVTGNPKFEASTSSLTMDGNAYRYIGEMTGNLEVNNFTITNTSTPTSAITFRLYTNVKASNAISITNPNGSNANELNVDIDDNILYGEAGSNETFTLGEFCSIYTSTNDTGGFLQGFNDSSPTDVVNINNNSTIRFDRNGKQTIPPIKGNTFGNIEFSGSGDKFISSTAINLDINGSVSRVGGTPVFRFSSIDVGTGTALSSASHTVAGNWNMSLAGTGDDEEGTITFDGANQSITASDFNNVVFAGTGTKLLTGGLIVDGNLTINNVTVDATLRHLDIQGDWIESGASAKFIQNTGGSVDFIGKSGDKNVEVTQSKKSRFYNLYIKDNTTLTTNSDVATSFHCSIEEGSFINISGDSLKVARHLYVNPHGSAQISFDNSSVIVMDGDSEQNLYNNNDHQTYPTLVFRGVGSKEFVHKPIKLKGDMKISSESTLRANGIPIFFEGVKWENKGNFTHYNAVHFINNNAGTTKTFDLSTSDFHDIKIGDENALGTATNLVKINLSGNITLNGAMYIYANGELDASANNYSITVDENWYNYGIFNAREGKVTFNGNNTNYYSYNFDNTDRNRGTYEDKSFYDLTISQDDERYLIIRDNAAKDNRFDVKNNFVSETGYFYFYDHDPLTLRIGGDFTIASESRIGYAHINNHKIILNATSGTHSINLNEAEIQSFEIKANASAKYELGSNFLTRNNADNKFTITSGSLDLNGKTLTINRGGLEMTGGELIVDEGSSLLLNNDANLTSGAVTGIDFLKTGGTFKLVGISGSPATITGVDSDGFEFTQTGGDFQAKYYTIATTRADGLNFLGGTIDTGSTGNNFSSGTFTNGKGNSYLTLKDIALGTISATSVIFNAGPSKNVTTVSGNTGKLTFVIAGGTLAGVDFENDATNSIEWQEDPGFTWTGVANHSWSTASNWTKDASITDADGIPDADDIVYINDGANNSLDILNGESFSIARLTVKNDGNLNIKGTGQLTVKGNTTILSGGTLDMTDNASSKLNIDGAWANNGTFNPGQATIEFTGTSGSHPITTKGSGDPFYNIVIGGGATYSLGSDITVTNHFDLKKGNFDASSGFRMRINKDWTVKGGTFIPGQGRVYFNGTSGTQSIKGGSFYIAEFENAASKDIDGNISVSREFNVRATSGNVSLNDKTIQIGGHMNVYDVSKFNKGTSTVIFNGNGDINNRNSGNDIDLHNVVFQSGTRYVYNDLNIGGYMTVLGGTVDIRSTSKSHHLGTGAIVNVTGKLSMANGAMNLWFSNYPIASSYEMTGGTVRFYDASGYESAAVPKPDNQLSIPAKNANIANYPDDAYEFYNLDIRSYRNTHKMTATLNKNIKIKGALACYDGEITLDVNGKDIELQNYGFTISDNETINWNGGSLTYSGTYMNLDADFNTSNRKLNNLTLKSNSRVNLSSDVTIDGDLTMENDSRFFYNGHTLTDDGNGSDDTFTMGKGAGFYNNTVGSSSVPVGFQTYNFHEESIVQLYSAGNHSLFTKSGTLNYGRFHLYGSSGTITMDGDFIVNGGFYMNNDVTLSDGGNVYNTTFNGANVDVRKYTPTTGVTTTFARNGDQFIRDYDENGQNLELKNVVFGGSGTKTIYPNSGDEATKIEGDLTINSGVTVTTNRIVEFSGANWTDNGTFNLTYSPRPLKIMGGNTTFKSGDGKIQGLEISNADGTIVTFTSGLSVGRGIFKMADKSHAKFGAFEHKMECPSFDIHSGAKWDLSNATINFSRTSTQILPVIDAANQANIIGIPSIKASGGGQKLLSGNIHVKDITIEPGSNVYIDADNTNAYQIKLDGSWVNNGGNFLGRNNTVIFNSVDANAKTIDSDDKLFYKVVFQGSTASTYTLTSNMYILGNTASEGMYLSNVKLDLNGKKLRLGNNDSDSPKPEVNEIGSGGILEVDAGASLLFSTSDNNNDVPAKASEIGAMLDVKSGGRLNVIGSTSDVATVSRSEGGYRIDINILSGATIAARYYNFSFLTDEGLEVKDGATVDATNNFSDGSWSGLDTGTGTGDKDGLNGSGDGADVVSGNRYLTIESDAALTINNVSFNFTGTPRTTTYNVTRSNAAGNGVITFTNTSETLGRDGSKYEEDGDATAPKDTNGKLRWDKPTDTEWVGSVSSDWDNNANWSGDAPTKANNLVAVINQGQPFNPIIKSTTNATNKNIVGLVINNGILKIKENGTVLDIDGDVKLGNGSSGTLLMDNGTEVKVQGSWITLSNATFSTGQGTVVFDASSGATSTINNGDQPFYNLTLAKTGGAGTFKVASTLDVNGKLTLDNNAILYPISSGYRYRFAGDIEAKNGATINASVFGYSHLDGAGNQTIKDVSFSRLEVEGSGVKTSQGTVVIDNILMVKEGSTLKGDGAITMNADAYIYGVFEGVAGRSYDFKGYRWRAEANSYTGQGTMRFNRVGAQRVLQLNSGDNPVKFYNLEVRGSSNLYLGDVIGAPIEGNLDVLGNFTLNSTGRHLLCGKYQLDNPSGTGTFTIDDNQILEIRGANNFPTGFSNYNLHDKSYTRYYGTDNQTIKGDIEYGHLYLFNQSTKTLGGNINVDGNLIIQNSTLDVSTDNHSISLAGHWDNEYGSNDGSFIARSGSVTFDGSETQYIHIGQTGTQNFNDVLVNKSGGSRTELIHSDINIDGNINVFNGIFDINGYKAFIKGNMNATGTGSYEAYGTFYLNATSGTPTIGTNGNTISGNIEINAPNRNYELVSNLKLNGSLTVTSGTLDVNGQVLSVGNSQDVVNVYGTLNVSTTSKPGGTLSVGNQSQVVIKPGGYLNVIGTASKPATINCESTGGYYSVSVIGTSANKGHVAARYYTIDRIGLEGFYINENTEIDATNNFSDGVFKNGQSGGKYLRIENTQDLSGSDRIENIVFQTNPQGGATNMYKATATSGNIEVFNFSGAFGGEIYDRDPNNLITWITPPTFTWTGLIDNDWFKPGNWDNGNTNTIPDATKNVIIPTVLNEPIITTNATIAQAKNILIKAGAQLKLNTSDADANLVDLKISGNLELENTSIFESKGTNDVIELAGNWSKSGTPLFKPNTSKVILKSNDGVRTIDNANGFYNLVVDSNIGSAALASDMKIANNLSITAGSKLDISSNTLTLGGNLSNLGTFVPQTGTLYLEPKDANAKTVTMGGSSLYNLIIGKTGGNTATYSISDDLKVVNDFTLNNTATLDLNSHDLFIGNADGNTDLAKVYGNLEVGANETLALGDDVIFNVENGGDFALKGGSLSSKATLKHITGYFSFVVKSGATFSAEYFLIEDTEGEGVWLQAGSTLSKLDNGVFEAGQGSQYLRLSNALSASFEAVKITFNSGPSKNVRGNEISSNNITFKDPAGAFAGPSYENDDGAASTGKVIWFYTNPLVTWNGSASTDWHTAANWTPTSVPNDGNTVIIPAGVTNYPVIDGTDATANSVTVANGASLTINTGRKLTVDEDMSNSGTLTFNGSATTVVGDVWTNEGTFNPGQSTVELKTDHDVTLSGGSKFYNLKLDATPSTVKFSTSAAIEVENDLIVESGNYVVRDQSHKLKLGGDLTVNTNGSFEDNLSSIDFNGSSAQNIGGGTNTSTLKLNNIEFTGSGVKTIKQNLNVQGDIIVGVGSQLALEDESIEFKGGSFSVQGDLNLSGGTSTVTFSGESVQVISGKSSGVNFDKMVINNTSAGNSDIQLNSPVCINNNVDFKLGIVQANGGKPMIFKDESTVSFDGTDETKTPSIPAGESSDGNSFVSGPVIKIGDDPFIFPTGEGNRIGRIAMTDMGGTQTTTDEFKAEYKFAKPNNFNATKNGDLVRLSTLEYWNLDRTKGSASAKVTLFFDATSEVNNLSTLRVAHYNGTSWDESGNTTTGTTSKGTITTNSALTSFSPFTLATTQDNNNPLPVELSSFDVTLDEKTRVAKLKWTTDSEINNKEFIIERSEDGISYVQIGRVEGKGTTSSVSKYSFTDKSPLCGINYYRLKQVDFNEESFKNSDARFITNKCKGDEAIEFAIYPNPISNNKFKIAHNSRPNRLIEVELITMEGKVIYHGVMKNARQVEINPTKSISAGKYILVLKYDGNRDTYNLIFK